MDPKAIAAAAKIVRAAYRRDRANRYALLEPWRLPPVDCAAAGVPPFEWDGKLIEVRRLDGLRIAVTVKPYSAESGVCDGCSLSPDLPGCVEASLFHDPWYLEMDDMSAATRIPVAALRRLGDDIFGLLAKALGAPGPVARLYHSFCRWLGGLAHGHLCVVLAFALVAALAGCSGCADLPDLLDGPVEAPVFERGAAP